MRLIKLQESALYIIKARKNLSTKIIKYIMLYIITTEIYIFIQRLYVATYVDWRKI